MAAQEQQVLDEQSVMTEDMGFVSYRHRKQVANYASQIALELSDTILGQQPEAIAVASFVNFNESLRQTNQLGNQLAESLIIKYKVGLPSTGFWEAPGKIMTPSGDQIFLVKPVV